MPASSSIHFTAPWWSCSKHRGPYVQASPFLESIYQILLRLTLTLQDRDKKDMQSMLYQAACYRSLQP